MIAATKQTMSGTQDSRVRFQAYFWPNQQMKQLLRTQNLYQAREVCRKLQDTNYVYFFFISMTPEEW